MRHLSAVARRVAAFATQRAATLTEIAFAGVFVAGVGMVYLPAGLMIAGILGVFAVERGAK